MTPDELEALILEAEDPWRLQQAFAPLDERARARLSAPAQMIFRQLYRNKADPSASDPVKAALSRRPGDLWTSQAPDTRRAVLALFALCPISVVRNRDIRVWNDEIPVFDAIIRDRRPDWLDDWIALDLAHDPREDRAQTPFPVLRGWIRDGVCRKPETDGYFRMFASHLMRTGFPRLDEIVPPISEQLLADPDLLADVEGIFRVETNAFNTDPWLKKGAAPDYETWPDALVGLSARGCLDRGRLLVWALQGLRLDLKQNQLSGMHGFYKRMAPDRSERRLHQPLYVDLLCHPVGHVARFALDMLLEVDKVGALVAAPVLRELPAVLSGGGKGNALAALKLLKRLIGRHKDQAPEALKVAGEALRHPHPEVQSATLDLLLAHAPLIDPRARGALAEFRSFIAASHRVRFAELIGEIPGADLAEHTEGGAAAGSPQALPYHPISGAELHGPLLRPEDAVAPIDTVDALIDAVLHAVEVVETPDEVERIIDAISRLADDRPIDFDVRVAPLLHRIGAGGGPNGALGDLGVRSALRDLALTWLTGRLHLTMPEEPEGYIEPGFLPMIAHLREVAARVAKRRPGPLLSAPTHRHGWIDPRVWIERVLAAPAPEVLGSMDFRLSLLRLAPEGRAAALERSTFLAAGVLRRVVRFALGGEDRPLCSDRACAAAWICAARCRGPLEDWAGELAPLDLDDTWPDSVRPARYAWSLSCDRRPEGWTLARFAVSVACEATTLSPHTAAEVFDRATHVVVDRRAMEWTGLPTVALNRSLDRKVNWAFEELTTPWLTQWLAFQWPQNPAAAYMKGVIRLIAGLDADSEGWTPKTGYLQMLFQRGRPWREPGRLLLCLGLVAKSTDVRGLAIDAVIEGVEARLLDPDTFISTMIRLIESGVVKLNRLSDALTSVIRVSPRHATVIGDALEKGLPKLDLSRKGAFQLIETLIEAKALTGQPVLPDARAAFAAATRTGKSAKLIEQILAQPRSI